MDPLSPQLPHTRNGKNSASRAHPATGASIVVRGEGGVEIMRLACGVWTS